MANVLTTLGVKFYIGAKSASDADTEPTQIIPQVIEASEFDLDPDTIDTTSFDNERYKSSVAGLTDTSGIQSFTANATDDQVAEDTWNGFVGQEAWLKIDIPEKKDKIYIPILPIRTGAYNLAVNDRITVKLRYTISGDMKFGASLAEAE